MDENKVTTAEEATVEETTPPETPDGEFTLPDGNPEAEEKSLEELFGLTKPDGNPEPEAEPDESAPAPEEPPRQDAEPDYKTMYEELSRSARERQNRETFRKVYEEQKAAGMSDAAARLVAKDAAGGKAFSLTDDAETPSGNGTPDYAAALNQLHSAFPDVKEIPAEVTKAMMDGGDPVAAYMGYQRTQDRKTIEELQAKVRDLEQKAANTVRAVARGVSGHGVKQEPEDLFLKGLTAGDW